MTLYSSLLIPPDLETKPTWGNKLTRAGKRIRSGGAGGEGSALIGLLPTELGRETLRCTVPHPIIPWTECPTMLGTLDRLPRSHRQAPTEPGR